MQHFNITLSIMGSKTLAEASNGGETLIATGRNGTDALNLVIKRIKARPDHATWSCKEYGLQGKT